MALRKPVFLRFLKNLKISKVQKLGFLIDFFYFCAIFYRSITIRMVYGMFFPGRNFVSGLLCTLKTKNNKTQKPKKPIKT